MGQTVRIGELADAVMETLEEYADLAAEDVKQAVRNAGETVRKEIRANAPKDTGDYAKSWAVKKTKETSSSLTLTVHSKNRYQLAHLSATSWPICWSMATQSGAADGWRAKPISPRRRRRESGSWKTRSKGA